MTEAYSEKINRLKRHNQIRVDDFARSALTVSDVDWLIEQAERTVYLQSENQWLYGKLNIIGDVIEKGRQETPKT